jgi:hypothetical protein
LFLQVVQLGAKAEDFAGRLDQADHGWASEVDQACHEFLAGVGVGESLPRGDGFTKAAFGLDVVSRGEGDEAIHPGHAGHQRPGLVALTDWFDRGSS